VGEHCKLTQQAQAEPSHQTHFGAIEGQNLANNVNKSTNVVAKNVDTQCTT